MGCAPDGTNTKTYVLGMAYALLELYIGRTKKIRANSSLELIWSIIVFVYLKTMKGKENGRTKS